MKHWGRNLLIMGVGLLSFSLGNQVVQAKDTDPVGAYFFRNGFQAVVSASRR